MLAQVKCSSNVGNQSLATDQDWQRKIAGPSRATRRGGRAGGPRWGLASFKLVPASSSLPLDYSDRTKAIRSFRCATDRKLKLFRASVAWPACNWIESEMVMFSP